MKRLTVFCFILAFLFGLATDGYAGWQLYDDFNSGSIDSKKWEVDDSSATITVENGRAKFVHQSGHARDNSWLEMIQNEKTIKGIKATITVESCSGDVRVRTAGFIGKIEDDIIFTANEIRADRQHISYYLSVIDPAQNYSWKADLFWGHFKYPLNILTIPYTLSMILSSDKAIFAVDGQGETELVFPSKLSPTDELFRAIGTRSNSGTGTCTAYFDDVFVYRQPLSPGTNLLLLDE
jgi:hypothetical protein